MDLREQLSKILEALQNIYKRKYWFAYEPLMHWNTYLYTSIDTNPSDTDLLVTFEVKTYPANVTIFSRVISVRTCADFEQIRLWFDAVNIGIGIDMDFVNIGRIKKIPNSRCL